MLIETQKISSGPGAFPAQHSLQKKPIFHTMEIAGPLKTSQDSILVVGDHIQDARQQIRFSAAFH